MQAAIGDTDVSTITSLKITAGKVTTVDWNYLLNLTALKHFEIDAAVTDVVNIPDSAEDTSLFPKSIVSVTVPQAIEIGFYAFYKCEALANANFPLATKVQDNAFQYCTALENISFPKITILSQYAFGNCTSLKTAKFPGLSLGEDIAEGAFFECTSLRKLFLGATPLTLSGRGIKLIFKGCPTDRWLIFTDENGVKLPEPAYTAAQNAYRAVNDTAIDGEAQNNDTWYGWSVIPLTTTISFDPRNGTGVTNVEAGEDATTITMPANPTWNDYTFSGWFTDKEYTTKFVNSNLTTSQTVYAKWTKNGKTVLTETLNLKGMSYTDKLSTEGWAWNSTTKTLTLSGLTLNTSSLTKNDAVGVMLLDSGSNTIILTDGTENTVDISKAVGADFATAISSIGTIRIKTSGNGTPGKLNAISANSNNSSTAIYGGNGATIFGGEIFAKAGESTTAMSSGICSESGSVSIDNGKITAKGGIGKSSYGIFGTTGVEIDDGIVTATSDGIDEESSIGIYCYSGVTLNGGTITANGLTATVASGKKDIEIDDISSVTVNGKPAKTAKVSLGADFIYTFVDESDAILPNALIKFKPTYTGIQALAPNVNASERTHNSITLNTQTITGEIVEYGIEKPDGVITWQVSPEFKGLTDNTKYKLYARVKANDAHKSGITSAVTEITTKTAPQAVSGKIFDSDGTTPISGATVTLKPINKATATDSTGAYTLTDIPEGVYNLVITIGTGDNAVTVTEKIEVKGSAISKNVSFLGGNKNTIVEVAPGAPDISVGGMNDLLNAGNILKTLDSNENTEVTAGGSVEIKIIIDDKTNSSEVAEDKNKIEAALTNEKISTILDLAVQKTVKDSGGIVITDAQKLSTLADLIEIVIAIPQDMRSKPGLALYRVHNGAAEKLTDVANIDGEMCTFSAYNTYATLKVKNFSTYALSHTAYNVNVADGGGSGSYAPCDTVALNAGSKSGYVFSHWSTTTAGVSFANANSATTTFVMPNGLVSITANWTLVGGGDSGSGSTESFFYITAKAGKGGAFSTPERVQVRVGESAGFTITPDKGYKIADVKVNGKSVGAVSSYVFTNILSDQSITASFVSLSASSKPDGSKDDEKGETEDKTEGETEETKKDDADDLKKVKGDLVGELDKKRDEAIAKLPDTLTDEQSQKAIDEINKIYDDVIKSMDNAKSADELSKMVNKAVSDFNAVIESAGAAIDDNSTTGTTEPDKKGGNITFILLGILFLLLLIIFIIIILKRKKKKEQ